MGKRSTSSKSTTPPKGRPTPKRDLRPAGRSRRTFYGWLAVVLAVAALIGVAIYFGSDQEIRPLQGGAPVWVEPADAPLTT